MQVLAVVLVLLLVLVSVVVLVLAFYNHYCIQNSFSKDGT